MERGARVQCCLKNCEYVFYSSVFSDSYFVLLHVRVCTCCNGRVAGVVQSGTTNKQIGDSGLSETSRPQDKTWF